MKFLVKTMILVAITQSMANATVYCCCDDMEVALQSEKKTTDDISSETQTMTEETMMRMVDYRNVKGAMEATLAAEARAINASSRYKDAIGIKETHEGLSAKATLDGAEIDGTIAVGTLRAAEGREQENLEAMRGGGR